MGPVTDREIVKALLDRRSIAWLVNEDETTITTVLSGVVFTFNPNGDLVSVD